MPFFPEKVPMAINALMEASWSTIAKARKRVEDLCIFAFGQTKLKTSNQNFIDWVESGEQNPDRKLNDTIEIE
jgi:hypothetical protein